MKLKIIPTKALTLSNVGELSWSWIHKNHIQLQQKKEKIFVVACLRLPENVEWGIFMSTSVQWQTSVLHVQSYCLAYYFNLLLFCSSRFCRRCRCLKPRANERNISLRASPGRYGGGAGKGKRACNYVSIFWISASKNSRRNAGWRRWR